MSVTTAIDATDPALRRARDLILRFGWNSTAYQILNPGISLWFSPPGDAVIGYVRRHRVRVVAGAPVCAKSRLAAVCEEFGREAAEQKERYCFFGAEARLESLYRDDPTHSMVLLGAQPSWHPLHWPTMLAGHASLRAQLHRARNKQVAVAEWSAERAGGNPGLQRALDEWLATRGLPALHFLVEPQTLGRLFDRRIFVAERAGEVVGFLVASPVPQRQGWLIEQIIRGRKAPNGTAELMIDAAVRAVAAEGAAYITLGLSPLSRRVGPLARGNPVWLRLLLIWVRAHGRRFYNFDGLDAFKAKFRPESWEPVYAISSEPRFSFRTLHAIAAAFSDGSPLLLIARGSIAAVRAELRRLVASR